jgi:membrane-bound lytic murein transglycosylase B
VGPCIIKGSTAILRAAGANGFSRQAMSSLTDMPAMAFPHFVSRAFALGLSGLLIGGIAHAAPQKKSAPQPSPSIFQHEQAMTPTERIRRWKPLVTRASHRVGVPVAWINAVMRVESGGRTMLSETQPMVSSKGAIGLMQVLPATYAEMRAQYALGPDPFNAKDNINAGAAYLKWLRSKYGYPAMFAAYNAGPGQVDDLLARGRPLPAETRTYVARVGAILGDPGDGTAINAARLTRPDGTDVLVDPLAVSAIRGVLPGEYPDGVQSVLSMGRITQAVREAVPAVTAAIRIRGGKV